MKFKPVYINACIDKVSFMPIDDFWKTYLPGRGKDIDGELAAIALVSKLGESMTFDLYTVIYFIFAPRFEWSKRNDKTPYAWHKSNDFDYTIDELKNAVHQFSLNAKKVKLFRTNELYII